MGAVLQWGLGLETIDFEIHNPNLHTNLNCRKEDQGEDDEEVMAEEEEEYVQPVVSLGGGWWPGEGLPKEKKGEFMIMLQEIPKRKFRIDVVIF